MFSTPQNLLVGIHLELYLCMKGSNFLSKNVFWENAVEKWWVLELSNLCHCVQHPSKLTSRDFWSSMNKRKPLSKQRCVLRKCCGVSQKWWMLELSNLCHCVQPPQNLLSSVIGMDLCSRNKRKPLSKQKCVLRKCCGGISETVNARAFKPLPLCSAKVGSSAKFCVVVCKSSLLWY